MKIYVLVHKEDLKNPLKWIINGEEQGTVFMSKELAEKDSDYQRSVNKGFVLCEVDLKVKEV